MIIVDERRRRTHRLLAFLAIAGLLVAACSSGGASASPAASSAPASQAAPTEAPSAAASVPAVLTMEDLIKSAGKIDDTSFCGTKPIKLGISDGLGENPWSAASYAAVRTEAAKCPNVTQDAKSGNYDVTQAISQINSWVAQGYDAIVAIPDAGNELAALQDATKAGVKVVPWASNPGGSVPGDYLAYVDWDTVDAGRQWADWMVKALNGTGNVVFLGGYDSSAVGHEQLQGINEVFDKNPGMVLLTGKDTFVATDWLPDNAQKAMTALLGKYPKIDGVITNYGTDAEAVIRAFQAAKTPLVPMTSLEANALGCDFDKLKAANPKYELATISSRNWLGRIAARKAIAAAQGLENTEPDLYKLPLSEDTLAGAKPQCDAAQGPDVYLSNQLTPAEMTEFGKVTN